MVNGEHPWVLAAPWYRWDKPGVAASGRISRPVFQKFESANFVADFLKDPQHSLKFLDPEDFVQEARPRVPELPTTSDGKQQSLSKNVYASTGIRKLYLDTHKRFYLVVCELHCDAPGFPSTGRDAVCEAGFVVRRRVAHVPPTAIGTATVILQKINLAATQLAQLDELPPGKKAGPLALARAAEATATESYFSAHSELRLAATELKIRLVTQGWVKSAADRVGAWQEVEETPQSVAEDILPMYPLIPDPRIRNHSAAGRTIYFGVVPTGSADTDPAGNPRYEDNSLYEIRCFVRRHRLPCPKRRERNDCHGPLVWSQRTISYRLASHFDLRGTTNRPVTIQLPDIPALEAQAAALKPGEGAPVRMVSPPGTPRFSVDTGSLKATLKAPGAQICSFSIPLITIVATFVFQLFLPVVTFVLGLFFLLKLKFCIPPSVDISGGVAAGLSIAFGPDFAKLDASLSASVLEDIAATQATDFSSSVPAGVTVDAAPANAKTAALPSVAANVIYEDRQELPR